MSRRAAVVLALSLAAGGAAQAQERDFHAQVAALYGFRPRDLTAQQIQAKSAELDQFWSQVKAAPGTLLPLLRQELAEAPEGSFLAYDGAKLLLSLSSDRKDRELALSALSKADLQDVDHTDYLRTVHWFAIKGFDTRAAALHVLSASDFKAFIPLHALTLGQNFSLIYMLFPMEGVAFERDLADRLERERDVQAQKTLLLALWYAMTPTGKAALKAFSERPDVDAAAASYARDLLARRSGVSLSLSSAESLRQQRAKTMQRPISDEALIEFDALTLKLLSRQ